MSSFGFLIPGQPPTGNKLYEPVWRHDKAGNRYQGLAKKEGVSTYQLQVMSLTRRAMPQGWDPGHYDPKKGHGLIVVRFWFYLGRAVDADNAMKVINDGIKLGLGTREVYGKNGVRVVPRFDDARFLGQAWWLETGHKEPRVEVELMTDWKP